MIGSFSVEQIVITFLHFVAWLLFLGDVWNTTGMPPSKLADIRQDFAGAPKIATPKALNAASLPRSLLRSLLFSVAPCALMMNYFSGHRSLYVAIAFLVLWIFTTQILVAVSQNRIENDFRFCQSALKSFPQS